jgi:hypothetical protein
LRRIDRLRSQRGVTMVELLIAGVMGAVIIIAVGSFYWRMTRAWVIANTQVAMQRQATLVQHEMTRIIQASDGVLPGTCGPSAIASLPVHVPVGALPETSAAEVFFCFYWPTNPGGILECRFTSAAATACTAAGRNLLLGDPTPQNMQASAATFTVVNNVLVDVAFTIQAVDAGNTVLAGPLAFATRIATKN